MSSFTHVDPQAEKSAPQVTAQPLAPHSGCPFAGVGQATPQSPQFFVSELTSTHEPLQFLSVPAQLDAQSPAEQTSSAAQACPQDPQFPGSFLVSTQRSPHWAKPSLHVAPHTPAVQIAMPLARVSQAPAQLPQLSGSVAVSTQLAPHGA